MAYNSIININIGLNTVASTREGFGTPLLASAHQAFPQRMRAYGSLADVAVDFETDSDVYMGAKSLFSQTPSVPALQIGRRESDVIYSIPALPVEGDIYTFALLDTTDNLTVITATAPATPTEEGVLTLLQTAVDNAYGAGKLTVVVAGTGSSATLTISVDAVAPDGYGYNVVKDSKSDNLAVTYDGSAEGASALIQALEEYNSDWYFFTSTDHTETFVLEAASEIEAHNKMYFWSTNQFDEVSNPLSDPAESTSGKLKEFGYTRTVTLFHHDAPNTFPELAYVGANAPYDAGSVTWANLQLSGVGASKADDSLLSTNHKSNIMSKNCNYIESDGGLTFTRTGQVASGEWIDIIRGRDWLEAEMEASLIDLLVNQKGGKVTFTDSGINQVRSVMHTVLQSAINRNFLESFTTQLPAASDVSFADKSARTLKDVSFVGYLAGAIHEVTVTGNLTYATS